MRPASPSGSWPNLYIVGAVKSGTTSLYAYLKQHPDIFFPEMKEPHYFVHPAPPPDRAHLFPYIAAEQDYLALYRDHSSYRYRGDASPSYLWSSRAAHEIRERSPDARILVILRDPVQRAHAQYLMDFNEGVTDLPFLEALKTDWEAMEKGWGISQLYVELGLYHEQIQRYQQLFSPERVKIVFLESLKRDPKGVLESIAAFLDVSPGPCSRMDYQVVHNHYAAPRGEWARRLASHPLSRNIGEHYFPRAWGEYIWRKLFLQKKRKPPLDPEARNFLVGIYRPEISRLEGLLGRPLPELRISWEDRAREQELRILRSGA